MSTGSSRPESAMRSNQRLGHGRPGRLGTARSARCWAAGRTLPSAFARRRPAEWWALRWPTRVHHRVGPGVILGVFEQEHTKENTTPMALSQSAVSELLDAFRAGDGVDLIRESVRLVLQELIEVEATEMIGAAPY